MSEPEDGGESEAPVAPTGDEPSAERAAESTAAPEPKKIGAEKKKKLEKKKRDEAPPIDDPRAKELEAAFTVGDYARTRELANELVKSDDARLADLGREYLFRTGVDPIQLAFLGLCTMVLIAIAWIYIPH